MSRVATSSRLLRRQLLERPAQVARIGVVQHLGGQRCYAADPKQEKEERDSFKGQLYHSTAERVQRDKAEQERFAGYREAHKARSSPPWLVPLGTWMQWNIDSVDLGHWLTWNSSDRWRNRWLLLRQANPQQPRHSFDQTSQRSGGTETRHFACYTASGVG